MLAGDESRSDFMCCYGYDGGLENEHIKAEEGDRYVLTSLVS